MNFLNFFKENKIEYNTAYINADNQSFIYDMFGIFIPRKFYHGQNYGLVDCCDSHNFLDGILKLAADIQINSEEMHYLSNKYNVFGIEAKSEDDEILVLKNNVLNHYSFFDEIPIDLIPYLNLLAKGDFNSLHFDYILIYINLFGLNNLDKDDID